MHKLRPYQKEAVQVTLQYFRKEKSPAVIVLPTGAGKSLVIAELARIAKRRVLVMAHVRELVEQNHEKFNSLGLEAGIFSAGLNRKEGHQKTIFGSIQSIARAPEDFLQNFSLLVIDECHRVSMDGETQYSQVVSKIQKLNPGICVLGLTATPYRLGYGWIYQKHGQTNELKTNDDRLFKKCLYELSIKFMIEQGYLTQPIKITSPVASYDFSSLKLDGSQFITAQIEALLKDQSRITPLIIKNIIEISEERQGVMIFTSSVNHAKEILKFLPKKISALVVGDTESAHRIAIINAFKKKEIKFLVNVSVLTTGFDAPHVDVIALLRPTESVSLFQQIVGRGLRLSPGKSDCLILDYTGQNHDLYLPEIEDAKPHPQSVAVTVNCPKCRFPNSFWGLLDSQGQLVEHFGRKCKNSACDFRFRFKICDQCGAENDIVSRSCHACSHVIVDASQKLKQARMLAQTHVMKVENMHFLESKDRKGRSRLEIQYSDVDGNRLKEFFYLDSLESRKAFYFNFIRMHNRLPGQSFDYAGISDLLCHQSRWRSPKYVIAGKDNKFWQIKEKIF